jgi:hypothetical protein
MPEASCRVNVKVQLKVSGLKCVNLVRCQFTRRNIPADLIFNNASSRTKNPDVRIPQYGN